MRLSIFTLFFFTTMSFFSSAWAADTSQGEKIFKSICVHCHGMGEKQKFAPNLTGIGQRRDEKWLDAWLKDPGELLKRDHYAQALLGRNKYHIVMPQIPDMQDNEKRASVITYLLAEF